MDIQAALAANAHALGVATGVATMQDLEAAGAAAATAGGSGEVVVLPSLEDTAAVLAALKLV